MSDPVITSSTGETAAPPPATPAPAIQGTPAPAPAISGAPPVSATTDDRSNWVPPHRLRETREAALREAQSQFATREAEIRREAEQYKSQLHALVGVQPPQNPEVQTVKSQFANLFPGLAKMEERSAQLEQLLERSGDLQSQNDHYWQSYGRSTMDRLFSKASESLGAPLTDEGKRQLHASFTGYVQSSPELIERYSNDPTLVEDFWKAFTSSFIDPARRAATATVVGRAAAGSALPQDIPGGVPRTTPAPQPANLDERADQAWALYNQNKR